MKMVKQLVLIGILSSIAAAGSWYLREEPETPKPFVCDPAAIAEDEICLADVTEGALWVDARSRSEWEENGVKGSILWNFDSNEDAQKFESEAAVQIISAPLVVVYCGSEACGTSRQIAELIKKLELGPEVKVLYGGWDALKDSN
ncbi:MAG: rhodanese-like domain-containing protein [Luteolibacter sp.]